jgi:hypothetical protein
MRLREVAAATGLDERTIVRLEKKGVITATRDATDARIFDPSVVEFIRRFYVREAPGLSPIMKITAAMARAGAAATPPTSNVESGPVEVEAGSGDGYLGYSSADQGGAKPR